MNTPFDFGCTTIITAPTPGHQYQTDIEKVKHYFGQIPAGALHPEPRIDPRAVPEAMAMKTGRPCGLAIIAFRMRGCGSPHHAAGLPTGSSKTRPWKAPRRYAPLTAEAVRAAIARRLPPDAPVQVIEGPAPR